MPIRQFGPQRPRARGFTIVELAIAIVVIGLLLTAIMRTTGLIGTSQSQAIQSAIGSLSSAIAQFRSRYGYLPGDIPNATTVIPGVVAGSCSATANGNGDGQIDSGESACVPLHLFDAGLIKGGTGSITFSLPGGIVTIRAIAASASAIAATTYSFPSSTRNVIEVLNAPCQVAQDIDNKMDDGNFSTGNVRASVTSCTVGGTNDPVPSIAVALQ